MRDFHWTFARFTYFCFQTFFYFYSVSSYVFYLFLSSCCPGFLFLKFKNLLYLNDLLFSLFFSVLINKLYFLFSIRPLPYPRAYFDVEFIPINFFSLFMCSFTDSCFLFLVYSYFFLTSLPPPPKKKLSPSLISSLFIWMSFS